MREYIVRVVDFLNMTAPIYDLKEKLQLFLRILWLPGLSVHNA